MDIRHLDIFVATAECRTFTEAAKRLSVTQASISYQVAELERRLGMRLFIRDRSSIRLSPAGSILYEGGRKIMLSMGELIDQAKAADAGVQGRLRIGYLGSLERILAKVMRRMHDDHPAIAMTVERLPIQALNNGLVNGDLDVVLSFSLGMDPRPEVCSHSIFTDNTAVVMAVDHPLASKSEVSLLDLVDLPLAMIAKELGGGFRNFVMQAFAKVGGFPRNIMETSSPESLLLLVESGLAVTLLAHHVVQNLPTFKVHCVNLREGLVVDTVILRKAQQDNPCVPILLKTMGIEFVAN